MMKMLKMAAMALTLAFAQAGIAASLDCQFLVVEDYTNQQSAQNQGTFSFDLSAFTASQPTQMTALAEVAGMQAFASLTRVADANQNVDYVLGVGFLEFGEDGNVRELGAAETFIDPDNVTLVRYLPFGLESMVVSACVINETAPTLPQE